MAQEWDVIVIGAGIVGSWTAYHLTQRGLRTLVLEQFSLPHTRGSSHGKSRLISLDLPTMEECYPLMKRAYVLWREFENKTQTKLLHPTGQLCIDTDGTAIPDAQAFLDKDNLPYELLSSGDLRQRFPQADFGANARGMLDPSPGVLVADTCLRLLQENLIKSGGTIKDDEPMLSFTPKAGGDPGVTVTTSKGTYTARKLVLCAGPWTKDVMGKSGVNAPVRTMPGLHMYWLLKDPSKAPDYSALPMIYHPTKTADGYRFFLLFPNLEYPNMVKIVTRGEPIANYLHPDERDSMAHGDMISKVAEYVRQHYPGVHPTPAVIEPCMYTMTPDRGLIIDYHPDNKNVMLGAGFSGNGFKFSPVVGEMLCDMAVGKMAAETIRPFRMNRYNKGKL